MKSVYLDTLAQLVTADVIIYKHSRCKHICPVLAKWRV
jgi:hypothetical protein